MRHVRKLFNVVASIAVLCIVVTLVFVVLANLPARNGLSPHTSQEGIVVQARITPTLAVYPPPSTPLTGSTPALLPSSTPDVVVPSSTPFPTTAAGLPSGSNIVFAETTNSELVVWAASAADVSQRVILTRIERDIKGFSGSISPNSNKMAVVATEVLNSNIYGTLYVAQLQSGNIAALATGISLGRYQHYPTWSPDSQYVAVLRQSNLDFPYKQSISLINTETGQETTVTTNSISHSDDEAKSQLYPLDWSSDGRYLYFQKGAYGAVELWRFDVNSGVIEKVNTISSVGIPRCYYLSPNDAYLLCLVSNEALTSYSVNLIPTTPDDQHMLLMTVSAEGFSDPVWNADGSQLAMSMYDPAQKKTQANIISLPKGAQTNVAMNPIDVGNTSVFPIGWSPNDDWLLVNTVSDESRFHVVDAFGTQATEFVLPAGATMIGWAGE
jgi:Tol biopolymer transport system component